MLMPIGENIKSLRESRGLTQAKLGAAVGVSGKAVSTWESGKREPRMGTAEKLAEFFGVTVSALFCSEECGAEAASDFEKFMVEAYRRMDAEQRAFLRAALVGALTGRMYVDP
jgi:transcriptional regulator with XRE-family HTH domain